MSLQSYLVKQKGVLIAILARSTEGDAAHPGRRPTADAPPPTQRPIAGGSQRAELVAAAAGF